MNDVLLLGAGFSREISSVMPSLDDLSSELKRYVPNAPGDNIEHWMTYLSQPHPWLSEPQNLRNKALFLELTQHLVEILSFKIDEIMKGMKRCPSWLEILLQWCHRNKVKIITLNYDTLLESAAQVITLQDSETKAPDLDIIYPVPLTPANRRRTDIFLPAYGPWNVDSSFKLFKLHGSINWYYSGASASTGETIYYDNVNKWDAVNENIGKVNSTRYLSDKVPFIVPPTTEKVAYFQHETIRNIWRLAGQGIQGAQRLFCIGYSLPETDLAIRFFLQSNAPQKPICLYIVNTNSKSKGHYKELLGNSYEIDSQYMGKDAITRFLSICCT